MKTIERRSILNAAPLIVSASTAFSYQANSQVRFGIIGIGGRGQYVGTLMANDPNARITAICDRYGDRIDAAKTKIPGAGKAATYRDAQQLPADPNVDAVLIATPVFMHPEHFEAAIAAKKHIYCEKPAGADVAGCKRLLAAWAKRDKTKRIQFGFQQRFSTQYLKAQFYGSKGMLETSRKYMKLHGMTPDVKYKSADDLRDTSLVEREESNADITGEATKEFFAGILAGKPYDMTKTAVESTLTAILGRMAIESKREVSWDDMMRSA